MTIAIMTITLIPSPEFGSILVYSQQELKLICLGRKGGTPQKTSFCRGPLCFKAPVVVDTSLQLLYVILESPCFWGSLLSVLLRVPQYRAPLQLQSSVLQGAPSRNSTGPFSLEGLLFCLATDFKIPFNQPA